MNSLRKKTNISYFHQFGRTCYIVNNKLYLKKFDAKDQRGIFLGYSERSKAYRVYNSETLCVEESMHVKVDDKEPGSETPEEDESSADIQVIEDTLGPDQINDSEDSLEAEPTSEAQDEIASDEAQMALSKQINPIIHSSTSLHILRIKSLETKIVLEEQYHILDKKSL